MKRSLKAWKGDESGATAIQYALIAAVVGIGLISAAKGLGSQIKTTLNTGASTMKTA